MQLHSYRSRCQLKRSLFKALKIAARCLIKSASYWRARSSSWAIWVPSLFTEWFPNLRSPIDCRKMNCAISKETYSTHSARKHTRMHTNTHYLMPGCMRNVPPNLSLSLRVCVCVFKPCCSCEKQLRDVLYGVVSARTRYGWAYICLVEHMWSFSWVDMCIQTLLQMRKAASRLFRGPRPSAANLASTSTTHFWNTGEYLMQMQHQSHQIWAQLVCNGFRPDLSSTRDNTRVVCCAFCMD